MYCLVYGDLRRKRDLERERERGGGKGRIGEIKLIYGKKKPENMYTRMIYIRNIQIVLWKIDFLDNKKWRAS